MKSRNETIAVIGLGYVGLPLAVEFAKKYKTIGFDINPKRIKELNSYTDSTNEVLSEDLSGVIRKSSKIKTGLFITTESADLKEANFFIVTVPTPTDENKNPVLTPLIKASETVAKFLDKNDIVIYESTVYPGLTEDE